MNRAAGDRVPRKWWMVAAVVPLLAIAGLWAYAGYVAAAGKKMLRAAAARQNCDVTWRRVHTSIFPPVTVIADDLAIRQRGRATGPPLISVRRLSAEAGALGVLRHPKHLRRMVFEGLVIQIPPEGNAGGSGGSGSGGSGGGGEPIVIDDIVADNTVLRILRQDPASPPLVFEISRLQLDPAGADRPMHYKTVLRNAMPPGVVHSEGTIALNPANIGASPVDGSYALDHADLSVFGSIRGTLASRGKFKGPLGAMAVDGSAEAPDFTLRVSGHPIHLKTEFHALVDGVNGDTRLEPVSAGFLRTSIHVNGGAIQEPGPKGKTVELDATVEDARVEDMLWLALREKQPALRGATSLRARIVVPPGEGDVVDRMRITAEAGIGGAHLKPKLQQSAARMSDAARGDPVDWDRAPDRLASDFHGSFWVTRGVVHFRRLSFRMEGIDLAVAGTFGLKSERIDLHGTARLGAKLSQTQKGVKRFLLKPFNALFKNHHSDKQTAVPIHIGGTLDHPDYRPAVTRILMPK